MFKNIKRKQKAIDRRYNDFNNPKKPLDSNGLFSKKFIEEIAKRSFRTIIDDKTSFENVIDSFICKDTLSQLKKTICSNLEATFCKPIVKDESKVIKHIGNSNTKHSKIPDNTVALELQKMFRQAKKNSVEAKKRMTNIKKKNEPYKSRVIEISASRSRASNNGQLNKRHMSQEVIMKSSNKVTKGRNSVGDIYDNHKKSFKGKKISTKKVIDPLQININLNFILDKAKLRNGMPQTCTNTRKLFKRNFGIISSPTQRETINKPSAISNRRNSHKNSEERSVYNNNNKEIKNSNLKERHGSIITGNSNGRKTPTVSAKRKLKIKKDNQAKKFIRSPTQKSIKNLLGNMELLGLLNEDKQNRTKSRLSPRTTRNSNLMIESYPYEVAPIMVKPHGISHRKPNDQWKRILAEKRKQ